MITAVFVMSTIAHRQFLGCVTLTSYQEIEISD
ncbi:uncharacterized protein METZ01_LOCUS276855 [marine metagenome]|uniref:Uncharacterized protein n=1 Tax=marine metagenome TaxID=408172 RepID=A0A382KMT4_9ZZZZ